MVFRCRFCNGIYNKFTTLINHQQTHRHIFRNRRELFRPSEQYKLFVVVRDSSPDQEVNPIIDLTDEVIIISSDSESENQQPVRPYGISGSSLPSSEGEVSSEDNITVQLSPKKRTSSQMEQERVDRLLAISGYNPDTAQYELTACHLPIHYVGYTPPWLRPSSPSFDYEMATPNTLSNDYHMPTPNTSRYDQMDTPNTSGYDYPMSTHITPHHNTPNFNHEIPTPSTSTNSQTINQQPGPSRPRTILPRLPMRRNNIRRLPMRRLPMRRSRMPLPPNITNPITGPSARTVVQTGEEETPMFKCPKCSAEFIEFEDLRFHDRTHWDKPK